LASLAHCSLAGLSGFDPTKTWLLCSLRMARRGRRTGHSRLVCWPAFRGFLSDDCVGPLRLASRQWDAVLAASSASDGLVASILRTDNLKQRACRGRHEQHALPFTDGHRVPSRASLLKSLDPRLQPVLECGGRNPTKHFVMFSHISFGPNPFFPPQRSAEDGYEFCDVGPSRRSPVVPLRGSAGVDGVLPPRHTRAGKSITPQDDRLLSLSSPIFDNCFPLLISYKSRECFHD